VKESLCFRLNCWGILVGLRKCWAWNVSRLIRVRHWRSLRVHIDVLLISTCCCLRFIGL
jgi:hypothetical protein